MHSALNDQYSGIDYDSNFRRYYTNKSDAEPGRVISFCPFCGEKLPKELSKECVSILDDLLGEWESWNDPRIPEEFKTDEWWKKRGL
jgi:hypothetical protein